MSYFLKHTLYCFICIYTYQFVYMFKMDSFRHHSDVFGLSRQFPFIQTCCFSLLLLEWIFAVCNVTSPFYIMPVLNGSFLQICLIKFVLNGRYQYKWELFSKCLSHNTVLFIFSECWSLSPVVREHKPPSRMLSDLVLKLKTSGSTQYC